MKRSRPLTRKTPLRRTAWDRQVAANDKAAAALDALVMGKINRDMLRRAGLKRSGPPKRKVPVRAKARKRAGMSAAQHRDLKELHRRAVMVRAGALRIASCNQHPAAWLGRCARCRQPGRVFCCHILPVGQYPNSQYEPANAFAGCDDCHMDVWHEVGRTARVAIVDTIFGAGTYERLAAECRKRPRPDYNETRAALLAELPPALHTEPATSA